MVRLDGEVEGGSLDAYEVPTAAEQVENWLSSEVGGPMGEAVARAIRQLFGTVAILKSVNVDENRREEGLGNELMEDFLGRASADVVLLVCDAHEGQAEGFVLREWYEGWGFSGILDTTAGPLMAHPKEAAERVLAVGRGTRDRRASAWPPVTRGGAPPRPASVTLASRPR